MIFLLLTLFTTLNASANCEEILKQANRKEAVEYARNIHKSNPDFYKSREVRIEQERLKKAGLKFSTQPQEMIADWLQVLEKTHSSAMGSERVKEKIEEYYFKKYIIKAEEIPESYYEAQKKIAREQGHGTIDLTPEARQSLADILIKDQKESLKKWLDYLLSRDANYPFWKKYWSFISLLKMGIFDVEKAQFQKRSKGQVALFPELNQEALSKVFEQVSLDKTEDYNFAKKYALEFNQIRLAELKIHDELTKVEGQWIKYPKGSDETKLVESLENKSTGWCTAGKETAKLQLSKGDFHVFYSLDNQGNPTIPRVAIRFEQNKIVEIRGRDKNQNLDSKIAGSNILETKLKEFGNKGDRYQKRSSDMKFLTLIEKKNEEKQTLTKEELRFLYETDKEIEGFGYGRDPRVEEVIKTRDIKKDISFALDVDPSRISQTKEEALSGNIIFHYGNLNLGYLRTGGTLKLPDYVSGILDLSLLEEAEGLIFPKHVGGALSLRSLMGAERLKLPEYVGGDLIINSLSQIRELTLPRYIGRTLEVFYLRRAGKLKMPEYVGGEINLPNLEIADELKFPKHLEGCINLASLSTVKELELPEHIEGSLKLTRLEQAKELKLPRYIGEFLNLSNLMRAKELKLPRYIGGDLNLKSLMEAKELKFPERIGGSLELSHLTTAEGLKLPEYIGKDLILNGFKQAEGLHLSKYVGGDLRIGIATAKGITLPEYTGGALNFHSLLTAEGLNLPDRIKGNLNLIHLRTAEGLKLPTHIEGTLNLHSLRQAEGLQLPEYIGGDLNLTELSTAKGVKFPKHIEGTINIYLLETAEGLELPQYVGGIIYIQKKMEIKLPKEFKGKVVH